MIGLAFFTILMMWQVYNTYCPLFITDYLVNNYGGDEIKWQWLVGVIMATDNVLALGMLPLFGYFSDKTRTKIGKRMPYIIGGTIASVVVLPLIPVMFYYNSFVGLMICMALVLIFMNLYRNPAVSLMPDITPKPLRAKANGLINLVGYVGAILAGVLAMLLSFDNQMAANGAKRSLIVTMLPFIITAVLMVLALILLVIKIRENQILKEVADDMKRGEELAETNDVIKENVPLSKKDKITLALIIGATFLWFAGFNAIETFWSNYSVYHLGADRPLSMATNVLAIASLLAFVPAGLLANKITRKWVVLIGIILVVAGLIPMFFIDSSSGALVFAIYASFFVCGVGWAFINCCSYPMVVELANKNNIGRFTGLYYSASMLSQSITPIVIGFFIGSDDFGVLFPYAAALFVVAGIIFFFIQNKRVVKTEKHGLEHFNTD
jgi:MFS family permease